MNGIEIIGLGKAVPKTRLKNDDLRQYMDTSDEWIRSRTGIEARHLCTGEESLTDLAAEAARRAMENAGIAPEEIGLVICATCTTDYMVPSMACAVQEIAGIPGGIPAFDINAACSGFVYGLQLIHSLMNAGSVCRPERSCALLIGGEQLSKMLDFSERSVSVLFGDGAAAAIVRASAEKGFFCHTAAEGDRGALYAHTVGRNQIPMLEFEGKKTVSENPLRVSESLASEIMRDGYLKMDGQKVFRFAVHVLASEIDEMEAQSGISAEDIDYIVCHQANCRIIDYVRKQRKLPAEKFFMNLREYGNTSGASIPLALADMRDRGMLKPGIRIFCVGFGAGLTWGGCYLEF
ncbi:MAG: beta-ketoacyl-ACP synthase 3 [Bilifractor sp.]|jgi:3-oxoacyl-[acyl-carrier-protein] synthase-3